MGTIAAISTPNAVGGIAMIRVSGDSACAVASQIFRPAGDTKVTEMHGYTCAYGYIFDGDEQLDDVVLTVFRAPHSFTGEDTVEITCHGGLYLSRRILSLLYLHGASPASPGEFTERAFLNGKLSLSQAEAVMSVIEADGAAALRQANLAKEGRLSKEMAAVSGQVVDLMSAFAYWLDDAEEFPAELERDTLMRSLTDISEKLTDMAKSYQNGRVLREGIRTVLLGRPNAGKSSVMNCLCGMQRSIVTDIAGTTRDIVTEQVIIGDYTLLLSDTAGLRDTDNEIESIGISQAYQTLDTADLVLYVVDATVGLSEADSRVLELCTDRHVLVLWNKTDLTDAAPPQVAFPVVKCSAVQPATVDLIAQQLTQMFGADQTVNQPVVMNERQYALIQQASTAVANAQALLISLDELDLIYAELEQAARALREIDGTDVSEDVIRGVFSKFCVGK